MRYSWWRVIESDLRKVVAEPFFWLILIMPVLMGWGLSYLLPFLSEQFQSIDLQSYYPLIIALLILTPPLYYGFVLALLLLEEKDEGVLLALNVTPLPLSQFLMARLSVYTLVSLPLIVFVHELVDVIDIDFKLLVLIAVAAAPIAPMVTMLLGAFCKDQLEGFVMGKGMGFLILFPLAMFFVPGYWHLICGILPTYWPIMAYYTAVSASGSLGFFYLTIIMALVSQFAAIVWLYRRMETQLKYQS